MMSNVSFMSYCFFFSPKFKKTFCWRTPTWPKALSCWKALKKCIRSEIVHIYTGKKKKRQREVASLDVYKKEKKNDFRRERKTTQIDMNTLEMCKYFHVQDSYRCSIHIYATQLFFRFEYEVQRA